MTVLDQPSIHAQTLIYASFPERVLARLIDACILIIPSLFIPFLVPWLYYALQEGSEGGATIGKRIMGIRVISVDGRPIGFGTATGRFFGNLLNMLTLFIGYALMFFNARNQCLHDMITSTIVVKNTSMPAQQSPKQTVRTSKRSWSKKISEAETHFVEMDADGGRHWHRSKTGEHVHNFTLWQLADGMVQFSAEFGPETYQEMRQYAEDLLRKRG